MGPKGARLSPGAGSGGRTRTPNNRARTCRVANYTTPEWLPWRLPARARHDPLDAGLPPEADDAADGDGGGLPAHVLGGREAGDGARARRRRRGVEAELGRHGLDAQRVEG